MAKVAVEMRTGVPSIDALKLDDIVAEVRKRRRWTPSTAKKAELWYRRFLALSYHQQRKPVFGICRLSDYVWHEHIMSTERYRRDCDRIFGGYLNHTPGKPSGWQKLLTAAEASYVARFHEILPYSNICCY